MNVHKIHVKMVEPAQMELINTFALVLLDTLDSSVNQVNYIKYTYSF